MQASATETPARLEGDKAQRIIVAMRESVAARGAAASTFDVVAREAGVSRGLLHYYFGSKERLLVEVTRRDCDERIAEIEDAIAQARSVDELVTIMFASVESFAREEVASQAVVHEMISAARHSDEIAAELAELYRRWRSHLAEALAAKQREGVVKLAGEPEAVAATLFAIADGLGLQLSADAEWDSAPGVALSAGVVRELLGG